MSYQLVDQFGQPVHRQELTKLQAEPGITGVRSAFAQSVASGITPVQLARILMSAAEGDLDAYLVLAEEMEEKDPHYASVLGVRKRAVSGVTPIVEPASEDTKDVKIADAVRENIAEHDGFPDLIEDMLDALGKGFSVVEIDWKKTAQVWTPQEFIYRDPRFFKFDRDTGREIRLIDERDIVDGIALEPFKFIRHKAKIKSGIAARGGLARLVAFSWICKAYDTKDWMAFVETYGLPLRLGRYGPEATKSDVEKLFMAVANKFVPKADHELALNRISTFEKAEKETEETAINTAVDAAIEGGKVAPVSRDYHIAACKQDGGLERFQTMVGASPEIAGKSDLDKKDPAKNKTQLSDEEVAVCKQLGMTEEEFATAKNEE